MPDLTTCQPLHCRNVVLSAENVVAWHAELAQLSQRLTARPPLPPLLAQRLQSRRHQIQRLLNQAGKPHEPPR